MHVDGTACDNFHPFVVQANLARPLVLFVFSLAVSTSEKNCGVALAVAKPTSFKLPEHLGYSSCSTLKLLPIHDTISLGSPQGYMRTRTSLKRRLHTAPQLFPQH